MRSRPGNYGIRKVLIANSDIYIQLVMYYDTPNFCSISLVLMWRRSSLHPADAPPYTPSLQAVGSSTTPQQTRSRGPSTGGSVAPSSSQHQDDALTHSSNEDWDGVRNRSSRTKHYLLGVGSMRQSRIVFEGGGQTSNRLGTLFSKMLL